jgi:hypothetical protein
MSYKTTVGKVLLKYHSPASTHEFLDTKELDKKNIGEFFAILAEKHPEDYKRVVSDLTRLGFESATRLGSTVKLSDLIPPNFKESRFKSLHNEIESIKAKKFSKKKEHNEIVDLLNKFSNDIDREIIEHGVKENKTLAKVVKAGARGSPAQYRQTIFSPISVNDNKGGVLTDFIIDRSFAEGLTLPQYLAHTFGSRQASAATKLAVADAGYLGKQLARAGMTVKIEEHDCGTNNGIAVKVKDKDYIGSFLAKSVDKFNYNNEVTSAMLAYLQSKGIKDIIVRNPITCQASRHSHPGAVCQICAGRREKGLPDIGSFLGIIAGTTLAEPLSICKGTLILMFDLSKKAVENIKIGDMIMGANHLGQIFPTKVTNIFYNGYKSCYRTVFRKGSGPKSEKVSIESTLNHKFLGIYSTEKNKYLEPIITTIKKKGKQFFAQIPVGYIESHYENTPNIDYNPIKKLINKFKKITKESGRFKFISQYKIGTQHTFDIEVDNDDHLFVLANGLISHNSQGMLNCLSIDTLVRMSDYSVKKIQDITPGEMVLGADEEGNKFPVKVLHKFNQGIQPVNEYKFNIGCAKQFITLRATEEHKILFNVKKQSCEVQNNDDVLQVLPLKGIGKNFDVKFLGYLPCYDLEVDSKSALFVLENGIIVHNSKHTGGSARNATSFGGFKYVNQLFNIPESFVHEAPLAAHEGQVSEIRKASQGGHYVDVKNSNGKTEEHYIHPDLSVFVHAGQHVEPGDVLSDGIPNPAKIVKHKGIGAGRLYFSKAIKDTFENSRLGGINKRNFDIVSKSLISHVRVTNPKGLGEYLPDAIVNYHSIEKDYTPRHDSKKVRVDAAKGLYLETPVLHYTIGTRLTGGMVSNLKNHGIEYVTVHEEHPGFEPEMHRLLDTPAHEHDWMHALYSTNLERRLTKAVNTGASSSISGPSPVPGLAYSAGFGTKRAEEPENITEEPLSFE